MEDKEKQRVAETLELIPDRLGSILEVGCGDGRILNQTPAHWKKVGLDIDEQRMAGLASPKIVGDAGNMPFRKAFFDLVLAAEVLEHLDDKSFQSTLFEMERVSREFVMITVPYKESLAANFMKCSSCSHIYNVWGHVRSFDTKNLECLFRAAVIVEMRFFSPHEARIPSTLYSFLRKVGQVWRMSGKNDNEACPLCGGPPLQDNGNLLGKILIRVLWRMQKHLPFSKPVWVACLYRKIKQ